MAVEQLFGRVVSVGPRTEGDELVTAAPIGSTELEIEDAADFDEDGGRLLFGGDVYEYESVEEGENVGDPDILHLATATTVAGAVGDRVDVFRDNDESGSIVVEYTAQILTDDMDLDDEPIEVTVHQGVLTRLTEGVRGEPMESVTLLRFDDGEPVLWEIDGEPVQDILADAAVAAADSAFDQALAALTEAQLALAISDGFVDIYYQTSAPWANGSTAHDDDTGDIWVDTDAPTDTAYRWLDRTWTAIGDASIVSALLAAQSAQTTADGKIRLYVQASPPTLVSNPELSYGDLWRETDNDNKEYYWNGASWVPLLLGTEGIATELIGKTITGGTFRTAASGSRIEMTNDGVGGRLSGYNSGGTRVGYLDFQAGTTFIKGVGNASVTLLATTIVLNDDTTVSGLLICDNLWVQTNGALIEGDSSVDGRLDVTGETHSDVGFHDDGLVGGGETLAAIGNGGRIKRDTSSRRYKTNIRKAKVNVPGLRNLVPKVFRRKDDGKDGPEYLGLIAEEVAAAGFEHLVFRDSKGRVDGIHFPALAVALLAGWQEQQQQIDDLTARMDGMANSTGQRKSSR